MRLHLPPVAREASPARPPVFVWTASGRGRHAGGVQSLVELAPLPQGRLTTDQLMAMHPGEVAAACRGLPQRDLYLLAAHQGDAAAEALLEESTPGFGAALLNLLQLERLARAVPDPAEQEDLLRICTYLRDADAWRDGQRAEYERSRPSAGVEGAMSLAAACWQESADEGRLARIEGVLGRLTALYDEARGRDRHAIEAQASMVLRLQDALRFLDGGRHSPPGGFAPFLGWDGTLHVPPEHVEVLRAVGMHPEREAPAEQLAEAAVRLGDQVHVGVVSSVQEDYDPRAAAARYATWLGVVLEEGVSEEATRRSLTTIFDGPENPVPALRGHAPDRGLLYGNLVPATNLLVDALQGLPGLRGRDVLLELSRVGADRKPSLLVDQVLEGLGVRERLDRRDQEAIEERVIRNLGIVFERNRLWLLDEGVTFSELPQQDAGARARTMGSQARMQIRWALWGIGQGLGLPDTDRLRLTAAYTELQVARDLALFGCGRPPATRQALRQYWIEARNQLAEAVRRTG